MKQRAWADEKGKCIIVPSVSRLNSKLISQFYKVIVFHMESFYPVWWALQEWVNTAEVK
jgi:hypothetical protein